MLLLFRRRVRVDLRALGALTVALGLLAGCGGNEAPDAELRPVKGAEGARIVPAEQALAGADIPTLDPASMDEAEISQALESGSRCDFRYTTRGKPVLSISLHSDGAATGGVVKLNGRLVMLGVAPSAEGGGGSAEFRLLADPVQINVIPGARGQLSESGNLKRREANAILQVGQSLKVGYRGYLDCSSESPTISPRETSGR